VQPASDSSSKTGRRKLALLFVSLVFSLALFLILDWINTARVLSSNAPANARGICFARDPVLHHALQADCSCVRHWGSSSYPFATNSLGLRDATIRQVPLTDRLPRLLVLGDSFAEGMSSWQDSVVGQIASQFPQYDFLNGGVESYSPSNYLNMARKLLQQGVQFDEVIVFIDISDAQDEAAFYRDADASGAVNGPLKIIHNHSRYSGLRLAITQHLLFTNAILGFVERSLVKHGFYHLNVGHGSLFDLERSAWTYRPVSDTKPYEIGYAPLGLETGLAKEKSKMTLLWQELQKRNIPVSVVVYPWPAQIAHDSIDSKQVVMWRDWCAGKCKQFVSVFPAFFAVKKQCPSTQSGCWYLREFIFGDEHYNRRGNALVAGVVGKSLRDNPPFKHE
jgi:hypothetical protein